VGSAGWGSKLPTDRTGGAGAIRRIALRCSDAPPPLSACSYGLPVNFVAVVFSVSKGSHRRLLQAVLASWRALRSGSLEGLDDAYGDPTAKKKGAGGDDYAIPGVSDAGGMPFVFLDFDVRVDTASAARN
jgi:hypothetical protein